MQLEIQELQQTGTATRCKTHRRNNETTPAAPAAQTRYLFSPAAATLFTRKTHGFVLRLPPQNIAHTTSMQPFQCDHATRDSIKNRIEVRTQVNPFVAKHIGGTIRAWSDPSCIRRTDEVPFFGGCSHFTRKNTRFRAPVFFQNIIHATFMQPFQCDLQQQLQEPHRTTHTGTTNRWKTHRRNNSRMKRPQPHQPHRRGTFHCRLQPLYTEKTRFRAPSSSQNIAHATFMQPFQCDHATRNSRTA